MKRMTRNILSYLFGSGLALLPLMSFAQVPSAGNAVGVGDVQISRVRDSVRITLLFRLDSLQIRSNRSLVLQPFFKGESGGQ